jgi:predicted TPR repeat methyltransferase
VICVYTMDRMHENWKHEDLPNKQLQLNLQQLSNPGSYPDHWKSFLECMQRVDRSHVLYDFGCGVGSTYKLLIDNQLQNKYIGIDFSDAMVTCAKRTWNYQEFYANDFCNTEFDYSNQIIYCNGLLDILPNGTEMLTKILGYNAKYVLLNRLNMSSSEQIETYIAYDIIRCIRYTFDHATFSKIVDSCGYNMKLIGTCFLLEKRD